MSPPDHEPVVDRYRPLSWRRRLLVVLLAVATAATVVLVLLDPPGGVQRKRPVAPGPAPCAEGQSTNCIGGKADVIVPVAPQPAPSPGPSASR
jgi:hypothetical protein